MANTIARRTYLTGGMGAHHEGESFGLDYELPPDRAYSETCAGVGSIMVNYRLLLATGDPRYADLIERTLFNVVAVSPAEDGRAFFYTNTLHQRVPGIPPSLIEASPRAAASLRAPWFEVSCCPTNVARTIASLGAYVATTDSAGVQIHQYVDSEVRAELDGGGAVTLKVSTGYPTTGRIRIEIVETPASEWELSLRVPAWADRGATITVGAEQTEVTPGTTRLARVFAVGDVVELTLLVAPRWTWPDSRVDAVRGSVAVERGPLVLCLESVDIPGNATVNEVRVVSAEAPNERDGVISVSAKLVDIPDTAWPYGHGEEPSVRNRAAAPIALIPYYQWANRGSSTMRVWLPVAE